MKYKKNHTGSTSDNRTSEVHEFAFYYPLLHQESQAQSFVTLVHDDLFHRLKHVVRIEQGNRCILFDRTEHAVFIFEKFEGKNKIIGVLQSKQKNVAIDPEITFLLPLLKIDALSDAIYSCAEVGITKIQLLITKKTQTPYSQKLHEKLHKVAIAAAEQSKMFAYPEILSPISLEDCVEQLKKSQDFIHKYYFDVQGIPFGDWYKPVKSHEKYYLCVGPEGDLTVQEKQLLQQAGFIFCALTSTILRSIRSISLVSAIFRL